MKYRGELNTEQQNSSSKQIDTLSTRNILSLINDEDEKISHAVKLAIPTIEKTVDLTVQSIKSGGRIFYVGAGTSGRLGVLDASEIPPTFSSKDDLFIGIISGGDEALRKSIEGAEDKKELAIQDLKKFSINDKDTVIGISCSGAALYVVSALEFAKNRNAKTVYIITNPKPFHKIEVNVLIQVDTGPEIITGSTRMKGGTATKMVLNMISTVTMIKLGKVYGNLMVDLKAVNDKLVDRGTRIISDITGLKYENAKQKLFDANKSVKTAIVMEVMECSFEEALKILKKESGLLRKIIEK